MKYRHIVEYVMSTPWAILPSKLTAVLSVLAVRAAGDEVPPEEIAARMGARAVPTPSQGAVAVLPLYVVLAHRMDTIEESSGGMSTERFGRLFDQAVADPSVGAIVFDVNSPGGTVPGVQELAAKIRAARGTKPIIAVANDLMASAAYWIASQADEIVGIPSSLIGSIGVFAAHEDLSKALALEGITVTLVSAGKYKTEGNPYEPLTETAKAVLQGRVDAAYQQFVSDVAAGRQVPVGRVTGGYGEGRALGAVDAQAAGLIDRIATMDETLTRVLGSSTSAMRAESGAARRRRLAIA